MQKNKIIRQALPLVPAMLLAGCAGLSQSPTHLEPAFWKGEPPDALVSRNGRKIDSAAAWMEIRRPELLHLFSTTVYGKPLPVPEDIEFRVLERDDNALGGKAIRIQGDILCKGIDQPNPFRLLLYLPKNAGGPVPVFLGLNFQGNHSTTFDPAVLIPEWNPKPRPRGNRADRYDLDLLLDAGYGLATIHTADIEPDRPDSWKTGVRRAYLADGVQKKDDPGTISTWAWGLSRGLDALLTIPEVDPDRVIVWGHSRLGKTSLWAAATDPRFAAAVSNDSGCGGASLTRHIVRDGKSETLRKIIEVFPHWFALNLSDYIDREEALPVDQHELLALVAPRPVYVASAESDVWADPEGEFLAAREASKVYRLFGRAGIPEEAPMPKLHEPVGEGIGYHIRAGEHSVHSFDWAAFVDFMNANLPPKK